MEFKIAVNQNTMAVANVKDDKLFVEVYKKIGEVERNGKKLPTFRGENKDSLIAKFNTDEVAVLIEGLKQYRTGGAKAFYDFAVKITGNEKFKNLLFSHGEKMAGLKVIPASEKYPERLAFSISTKEKDYSMPLNYASIVALEKKLEVAFQNMLENGPAITLKMKNGLNEDKIEEIEPIEPIEIGVDNEETYETYIDYFEEPKSRKMGI